MIPTIPLPPESQSHPLIGNPGWTPHHEVKYLCWLARQVTGDILEIGCNNGQTTLELAIACPDKTVYGCDWTGAPTMCDSQRGEQPDPARFCELARHLPNVRVFNCKSEELAYESLDLGLIFIDGDHSYEGVKKDTEKALSYFARKMQNAECRMQKTATGSPILHSSFPLLHSYIVWHDCYPEAPDWCGVWRYLQDLLATPVSELPFPTSLEIQRVAGTWLAVRSCLNDT